MAKSRLRAKPAKSAKSSKPAAPAKSAKLVAKAKPSGKSAKPAKPVAKAKPPAKPVKPAAKAELPAKPVKPVAKAKLLAKSAKSTKSAKPPAKPPKPAAKAKPAKLAKQPKPAKQTRRPTNQLSLPGLGTANAVGSAATTDASDDASDDVSDDASSDSAPVDDDRHLAPAPAAPAASTTSSSRRRTRRIARAAAARAFNAPSAAPALASPISPAAAPAAATDVAAPVLLGTITIPSGTLAIFDIALIGYLPRPALDPLIITAAVPADRPLPVIGTRVGAGRFADCWHHVTIDLQPGQPGEPGAPREPAASRKLGEAAVDFARLICLDRDAIAHWQHEDSLDHRADFVFWGRDEAALAKAMTARRLGAADSHHGWTDLPVAEAEAKADRADALKREHGWQITAELRPHSHHFLALAAARASGFGAGMVDVAATRGLMFFTSWGDGVYPVFLDLDTSDRPLAIRILLAPPDAATKKR